ncbi:uncharacterized protein LOC125754439 isoform X2 [Canis lupus dingo]|uniref:uncharacterized protein LOC125754439 isoform X2 n=1 Tax=Canis lupus dingo TaxID=286419 RepID=UPI0020C22502|nr:uncharacterized protein LOC125754439 isoform X2 [Canis lupus dingo]
MCAPPRSTGLPPRSTRAPPGACSGAHRSPREPTCMCAPPPQHRPPAPQHPGASWSLQRGPPEPTGAHVHVRPLPAPPPRGDSLSSFASPGMVPTAPPRPQARTGAESPGDPKTREHRDDTDSRTCALEKTPARSEPVPRPDRVGAWVYIGYISKPVFAVL